MKHLTKIVLLGIVVLGAAACQRESEAVVPDNPTYDKNTNSVTTQFVLNISTDRGAPSTKQTDAVVQATTTATSFRGMTDVHLLSYDLDYAPSWAENTHFLWQVAHASSKATRDYDMGTLAVSGELNEQKSSRVMEVSLPLETNAILLYGRAIKPTNADANVYGSVSLSGTALNSTLENVRFGLVNRLKSFDAFKQYGKLMGAMITYVLRAGRVNQTAEKGYKQILNNEYVFWWPIDDTSNDMATVDGENNPLPNGTESTDKKYKLYRGEKTWRDYGLAFAANLDDDDDNNVNLKALEEVLAEAYYRITTLGSKGNNKNELRAGSAAAVLRMSSDLYSVVDRVRSATATSPEEHIAKLVGENILIRAGRFFTKDGTALAYYDWPTIKSNANTYLSGITVTQTTDDLNLMDDKYFSRSGVTPEQRGFPINLDMPVGSSIMTFESKTEGGDTYDVCKYAEDIPAYGLGGGSVSVNNYRYPTELMYYTNSPLRVSNTSHVAGDYPKTTSAWDGNSWSSDWQADGTVKSTTRSVAVTKEVNYGTALLKTTVAYGASVIKDNNSGIHTSENDNDVDVSGSGAFKVTGLIIGGAPEYVGWDFLPIAGDSMNKLVYDRLGDSQTFSIPGYGTASSPIYTMTWDNYNSASAYAGGQPPVYVALELVNTSGKDLWGELNVIRNNGTFYLVGKLDPTKADAQKFLPTSGTGDDKHIDLSRTNFFYPPFDSDGKTINAPRVFMQDYMTEVNFIIGVNSLKYAYVTMPDLRASQVSLGLSVDLKWAKGLVFDVEMGDTE